MSGRGRGGYYNDHHGGSGYRGGYRSRYNSYDRNDNGAESSHSEGPRRSSSGPSYRNGEYRENRYEDYRGAGSHPRGYGGNSGRRYDDHHQHGAREYQGYNNNATVAPHHRGSVPRDDERPPVHSRQQSYGETHMRPAVTRPTAPPQPVVPTESDNIHIRLLELDSLDSVSASFKQNYLVKIETEEKLNLDLRNLKADVNKKNLEIEELQRQLTKSRLLVDLTKESLQDISLL